jgi:hypothetical protein
VLRARQPQLVEEDARELVVVMLAGMDQHLVRRLAEAMGDRRGLDKLRPIAHYGENAHGESVGRSRYYPSPPRGPRVACLRPRPET